MAFNPTGANPWLKYNRAAEAGELPQPPQDKNYPVKLAYPDWWPAMREFAAPPTEGQPYWTPRRIGRYYNALQSVPYAANVPSWIDVPKIETAYKMLSDTRASDWQTWEDNLDIDPGLKAFVSDWAPPPLSAIPQWEQDDLAAVSDALKTDTGPIGEWTDYGIDYETWQKLPLWKQYANKLFRSMGGQMLQQAVNLGVGGAYAAGVPGFVVGASAGTLLGYLGTQENELALQMGENYEPGATYYMIGMLNFLFTQAQQGMAFRQQITNAIRDPETYGKLSDVLKDIPASWEAGEGFYSLLPYEVGSVFGKDGKVRVINIAGEDTFIEGAGKGISGSGVALAEIRRMLSDGKLSPAQVREYTIQRYGGFAGEMTDLLAGFALDPLDLIGPVTGGIIGNVADKTGNVPLAKSLLAPTGQGELLSGYRRYRQELRQMPVDDLRKMSNAAQWFAGVDKSGQDVTLRQTQRGFVDKMFGATPQARADESLHQFVDGMSTMLDMEQGNVDGMYRIAVAMAGTPGQAVDAVANGKVKVSVGGVLTDVDMPRWSLSAEAQVVPLMLKDQMPKVKDHYDLYRNTRPQANLLTRISEALGEDMYRTIADLHTGKADYDGVMKRIVALANEGNKAAADFVKNTAGMKDLNNAALKKAADLFSGEGGAAFDGKMWGVQLMHILSEGAEKWAVDWFGIKPSGWAMRLGDVIKKAQSQMLLGLNPSYLANNAINNIVTLAWDGLFSNLSKKQRMEWIRRYGYTTQLRKGMGGAEIGEMEAGTIPGTETGKAAYKLGKHLREATRAKDGIQKAQDLIGGGNKFMAAAILSQKVERWSSEIATVKGTMEYWDGYWRAGVGFDKMDSDLRMVLDGVQNGLADRVEKAIARGLNKAEIEKEVFTRLEVPSLRDVMTPEDMHMMSSFPGLMNEIDKGMRDATNNEDRRAVFQQAISRMEKKIDEDISRKAVVFVHQTAAKVQAEGYAGAFDVMDTLVPERHEFWQQHMQHMDDVAMQAESLTGLERANLWREELAIADREWRTFHNAEGYKWFGIFEGLGAERTSDTGVMVERNLMDVHSVWDNFYNTRKTLMDEYFGYVDTTDFTGLSKEEARAVRSAKWGEINEKLNAAYGEAIIVEDLYQSELDRLFYKQYAQQFGTDAGMAAIKWRDEQRKIRRTMVEAQLLWRTANLSGHIQKSFGGLLPKETIEKILLLNGNEPIYKMSVGERDKANQKFYREIYRPLLGEMMKAPVIEKPKPGKPKVEKPVVEKPAVAAKPKEPEQTTVWKYIAETRPEMAGVDDKGLYNSAAKLNIIKWLLKWSENTRLISRAKKGKMTWAYVTPALIHEAAQAEDYFNAHKPETAPVEEPTPVTETVTEVPAEPVQEVSTEQAVPVAEAISDGVVITSLPEDARIVQFTDDNGVQGWRVEIDMFGKEFFEFGATREEAVENGIKRINDPWGAKEKAAASIVDAESVEISDALAEEARFTEGMTPDAAAEVEQAQRAAAAREQVIAQAESMRQNVDEIMRLAPPKEVNGEIFREYIHQIMADKYPDKPSHAANRADAVWTVIDRIATTLAKWKGISKDEWYNNFVLSRGGTRIWGDNALYRITPEQARATNVVTELPNTPEFLDAVKNTPSARITDEGLFLSVVRYQDSAQEGAPSVRTGVFYLVSGDKNVKFYRPSSTSYGGGQKIEGETLIKKPMVVKGATGGKAPETAYDTINGKGAYQKMRGDVLEAISGWGIDKYTKYDRVYDLLTKYTGNDDYDFAQYVVDHSTKGNQLAYAIQENIAANSLRNAGYDAIIGYSKRRDDTHFISEVFDLREITYPSMGFESDVHSQYLYRTDPEQFYARLDRLEYTRTDDGIDYTLHFKNKESTGDLLTYEEARTVLGDDLTAQILAGENAGIITGEALRKIKPGGYSVRGATGATYWLDNGKAVMHAFSRADIADVMHEYIHAITPLLPDADLRTIERWYAKEYGRELGADWMDKTYPDVDAFEKLARAFERYMTEGPTGFTGEILQALENIKAWMLDIYKNLTHADIDIRMNDEIRAMFDRWLGQEPKKIAEPAPVEPSAPSVWQTYQRRPSNPPGMLYRTPPAMPIDYDMIGRARNLGVTDDIKKAGFVDLNGEMLDMSQGYNWRIDSHITLASKVTGIPVESTWKAVDTFLKNTGAIRIAALATENDGINIDLEMFHIPNKKQLSVLESAIYSYAGNKPISGFIDAHQNGSYRIYGDNPTDFIEQLSTHKSAYQPSNMLYRIPTDNEGAPLNEPPAQNAPLGTADELMGVPVEEITMAGWNQHLRPALERAQNAMLSQTVGKIDLDESLPQEGKVALRNYLGQVYSQMADVKMGATRWGESRRNAALLDYNKRTGVDNTILGIFPYQFWYTRTAINWALRVLNKPSIAANYYRLLRMSQRKEERDGYPRRLKGKIAFPMPWLPDFMGDNIYIDPWKQALPILQMTRPFERAAEEKNQAARRTQQLIYDMVDSGEITDEQAQQAITDKGGAIYIKAKAQAENESERDFQNPLDFAFALSNPLLPISVAYDVATGRADRISQLPFTRLVQNLTAMAGIGGPRGVNLEAGIRKAAGLPTIDRFEDYRVDRELASMTAEGLVDADTATTAMIDRTGQVFEDAQRRVSQQGAIRYFGTALALDLFPEGEAKQRGLQDEFAAAYDAKAAGDAQAVNKFFDKYPEYGARLASFKEPEERMRAFLRGIVWEKYLALPKAQSKKFREAAGDVFAEAFLDSETRSYDSISTDTLAMWANSLGETPETASKSELPVDWLDDETAKQIDTYYNERTRIFGEYDPNAEPDPNYSLWQNQYLAQHPNLIQYVIGETNALYGLPQDIQVYVYQYRAARDMRYPNIFNVQDKYFTITNSTQKKSFIKAHPELKEYWGWRKQMAANFPKAAAYIMSEDSLAAEILDEDYVNYSGNSGGGGSSTNTGGGNYGGSTYSDGRPAEGYHPPYLTGSELKRFSRPLVMQLLAMFYRNEGLMTGANNEITAIWEELGKPFGTLADFIEYAVRPTLTQ